MKIVSPYRPFPPARQSQIAFDWIGALEMLRASARAATGDVVHALTDVDTALPGPCLQVATTERRLMLWILDVTIAYLSSEAFDDDTVLVSPDVLLLGDLRPYFRGDLTLLMRTKFMKRPILNAVQWWPRASRDRLVAFYRQALDVARGLSEDLLTWGADSESLRQVLDPVRLGLHARAGLQVSFLDAWSVMYSIRKIDGVRLDRGEPIQRPAVPIIDFKYTRKAYMARYFAALQVPR